MDPEVGRDIVLGDRQPVPTRALHDREYPASDARLHVMEGVADSKLVRLRLIEMSQGQKLASKVRGRDMIRGAFARR